MDFVAIDVETANANMASICQIGLAAYSSGSLVDEWKTYVDPLDFFDPMNVSIHGITEETVAGAPTLPEIAEPLLSRLNGCVVLCHTHFDRVSVHQALSKYGLRLPECEWMDSARVARRTWKQFATSGYGLQNLCDHIGYEFAHHDALEDAKAAAQVMLAAMQTTGLTVEDWLRRVQQPIDPSAAAAASRIRREGNPEGPLFGEVMVFTGALQMPRREAADLAASVGCEVADHVSKSTTTLVVGDQDVTKLAGHEKSAKHRKVEDLIAQGQEIRILRESDFTELVALVGDKSGSLLDRHEPAPSTQAHPLDAEETGPWMLRGGEAVPVDEAFEAWTSGDLGRMLAALGKRTNLVDRHFLLMHIVGETYRLRADRQMAEKCLEVARMHVDEFPQIACALRREFGGTLPQVATFQHYATLLTECGEFEKAIQVCEGALAYDLNDGTTSGFEGRIERIKKQAARRSS